MESQKNITRRSFIRKAGTTMGVTGLAMNIMSSPFRFLYTEKLDPSGEFSLLKLRGILPDYNFPFANSFSTDSYSLHFNLHNVYPRNRQVKAGEFTIEKKEIANSNEYKISIKRLANADQRSNSGTFYYFLKAGLVSKNDLYSTPDSWNCETRIGLEDNTDAYMNTGHVWKGSRKDNIIELHSEQYKQKKHFNKNLTWKWGIIDMVQRMAEKNLTEASFSALDEFDLVYENQSLKFRKKRSIDCGEKIINFKVYDLTGDGIIPTVYWIDNANRVCFIVTGMEAYIIT